MGFYLSILIMNYYYQYLCWNLLHNKIPSDHYITMHRRSGHMFAFSQWRPQQPDAGSAFEIWPTGQNKIKIIWTEVYERRKKRQMFETRPAAVRRVSVRCCWSVTGSVVRYRADQINVGSGNLPVIFYDMLWCRNTFFFSCCVLSVFLVSTWLAPLSSYLACCPLSAPAALFSDHTVRRPFNPIKPRRLVHLSRSRECACVNVRPVCLCVH